MRELPDERKKVLERLTAYEHWDMIPVKDYAVFVVVAVRRILEVPITSAQVYGNEPDVLSRGVCVMAVESFILLAE